MENEWEIIVEKLMEKGTINKKWKKKKQEAKENENTSEK